MKQLSKIDIDYAGQNERSRQEEADNRAKSASLQLLLEMDRRPASRELAAVYHLAVRSFKPSTVRVAVEDFITGTVEGVNLGFCPSPPQLAAHCRKIQAPEDAFNRVWNPSEQQMLESKEAQHKRELELEKAKTPEQKLDAINRIRKAQGMEPHLAVKRLKEQQRAPEADRSYFDGWVSPELLKTLEDK